MLRQLVPKRLRQHARSVLAYPDTFALTQDLASFRTFRRLENSTATWPADIETVRLRLRPLAGASLAVRPGTSDRFVLRDTFLADSHLPPEPLASEQLRVILDLGAHIGSTAAHLAVLYPQAKVVAVELDPANAELCRENLAAYGDRCVVERAAVWHEDGSIAWSPPGDDPVTGHVVADATGDPETSAPALSLDTLIARHVPPDAPVDYMKIDVESAERELLRHPGAWVDRVRSMKIEVHAPYSVRECLADLERLGYTAELVEDAEDGQGMPVVAALKG